MPINYGVLYQGQLGNAVATLFTVAAGQTNVIKLVTVVNTDSSTRTFGFNVNGTAAANAVTPTSISIAAGAAWEWNPSGMTLGAAATFAGGASVATKLTTTVYGATIS
jgi:hypothetical protein